MSSENPEKALLELLMEKPDVIATERDKPPSFFTDERVLEEINKTSERRYDNLDDVPNEVLEAYFRKHRVEFGNSWYLDELRNEKARKLGEEVGYGYYA